ncbi:hypothetical protein G3N92_32155, partial [Burkholderia sp. Ac-20379]|nr:hypothetical protein [Burkholderia sp. Ac-20379]
MSPPPPADAGTPRAGTGFVLDRATLAALTDVPAHGLVERIFAAVRLAIRA